MNIWEIMKHAPRYLTLRYGALNSYVWESLFPREEKNRLLYRLNSETEKKKKIKKMQELVNEATLLVFIFVTRKIFIEGSNAAKEAVDILKELGVNEFYLGDTKFSERNENVILGDTLAKKLFESLGQEMRILISESNYISDILNKYQKIKI